jgi:hypothetical protein
MLAVGIESHREEYEDRQTSNGQRITGRPDEGAKTKSILLPIAGTGLP